jgi:predicted RNase H-like HicB family nuclease
MCFGTLSRSGLGWLLQLNLERTKWGKRSEPDEEVAYWVECPSLRIASMGETIDEAIRMIQEAIELHLEDLAANGEPVEQSLVLDV